MSFLLILLAADIFLVVLPGWTGAIPLGVDTEIEFLPRRAFAISALAGGESPLWNPYLFCGWPQFAALQDGMLFPTFWIYLFFAPERALWIEIGLLFWLAGAAYFIFSRYTMNISVSGSILACLTFLLGHYYLLRIFSGQLPFLRAFSLLPVVFGAVSMAWRRIAHEGESRPFWILFSSIVFAFFFLAGYPPVYGLGMIALAGWGILTFRSRSFLLYLALSLLLSFFWSAPQLLTFLEFLGEAHQAELAPAIMFPLSKLVLLVMPEFFGSLIEGTWSGEIWEYWEQSLFFGWLPLLCVFLSFRNTGQRKAVWVIGILGMTGVLAAAFLPLPSWNIFSLLRQNSRWLMLSHFFLPLLAGCGWDWAVERFRIGGIPQICLFALFLIQLYFHSYSYLLSNAVLPALPALRHPEVSARLSDPVLAPYRIAGIYPVRLYNLPAAWRIPSFDGYDILVTRRYHRLFLKAEHMDGPADPRVHTLRSPDPAVLKEAGVGGIVEWIGPHRAWHEPNPNHLRVSFAKDARPVVDVSGGVILSKDEGLNSLRLTLNVTEDRGELIWRMILYPGWQVILDGIPFHPDVSADAVFYRIPLAHGAHTVLFRYRPASLTLGCLLFLLVLVSSVIFLTLRLRRTIFFLP